MRVCAQRSQADVVGAGGERTEARLRAPGAILPIFGLTLADTERTRCVAPPGHTRILVTGYIRSDLSIHGAHTVRGASTSYKKSSS